MGVCMLDVNFLKTGSLGADLNAGWDRVLIAIVWTCIVELVGGLIRATISLVVCES